MGIPDVHWEGTGSWSDRSLSHLQADSNSEHRQPRRHGPRRLQGDGLQTSPEGPERWYHIDSERGPTAHLAGLGLRTGSLDTKKQRSLERLQPANALPSDLTRVDLLHPLCHRSRRWQALVIVCDLGADFAHTVIPSDRRGLRAERGTRTPVGPMRFGPD